MRATEEELEQEPDLYQCDTCLVRQARATLTEGNHRALELYGLLARRVVVDFRLERLAFELAGLELTRVEAKSLFDQLSLIHDARCPVPKHG